MEKKLCFRVLGLIVMLIASMQAVNAMTFTPSTTGKFIFAEGSIIRGDNQRLIDAIDAASSQLKGIILVSNGGDLATGQRLAATIRSNDLGTYIQDNKRCISACTDVFLGGVTRNMHANAYLGYHGSSISDDNPVGDRKAHQWGQSATMTDLMFVNEFIGLNSDLLQLWDKTLSRPDINVVWYPDNQYLYDANILNVKPK